jgi:acetyl-CoA carboxylase beta subunit
VSGFAAIWDNIPGPIKTIINVALGAAVAAAVTYLVGVASGGTFDANALIMLILTAAGTAAVRAINPADTAYGVGATDPTVGA